MQKKDAVQSSMELSPRTRRRIRLPPILTGKEDIVPEAEDASQESSALAEQVLRMCYGPAGAGMTLRQIAASMGISRTRLVEIRDKALWEFRCRGASSEKS